VRWSAGGSERPLSRALVCAKRAVRRVFIPFVIGGGLLVTGRRALEGHLLINFTPSIPRGVYWISAGRRPQRGDLVAFPIPEAIRALVHERGYVPHSVRLFAKPVVALGGDYVCVRDHQLVVNEHVVGEVLAVDRHGKPMPQYAGCGVLASNELFVSTHHDNSFDSRYFGPLELPVLRGTLSALVTF
jgi:conjugative transfer signal peptidase TraF